MRTGSRFAGLRWLAVAVIVAAMLLPALTASAAAITVDSFDDTAGLQVVTADPDNPIVTGSTPTSVTGFLADNATFSRIGLSGQQQSRPRSTSSTAIAWHLRLTPVAKAQPSSNGMV